MSESPSYILPPYKGKTDGSLNASSGGGVL